MLSSSSVNDSLDLMASIFHCKVNSCSLNGSGTLHMDFRWLSPVYGSFNNVKLNLFSQECVHFSVGPIVVDDSWLPIFWVGACGGTHFHEAFLEDISAMATVWNSIINKKSKHDFLGGFSSIVNVLSTPSLACGVSVKSVSKGWAIRTSMPNNVVYVWVSDMISGCFGNVWIPSECSNWLLISQIVDGFLNSGRTLIGHQIWPRTFSLNNIPFEVSEAFLQNRDEAFRISPHSIVFIEDLHVKIICGTSPIRFVYQSRKWGE